MAGVVRLLATLSIDGRTSTPGDSLYRQPGPIGLAYSSPPASEILVGFGTSNPGDPVRPLPLRRMS